MQQNNETLIGIVSEKEIALTCTDVYVKEKNISFFQKELIAYYLPQDIALKATTVSGELRAASAADMPFILEWIQKFYEETLHAIKPDLPKRKKDEPLSFSLPRLFIWWDSRPVAMGMLTGSGETCRLNLIYTAVRGKGYGKAIVSSLALKAREAGQIPMLYANCDNTAANNLYTSFNFREAGRLTEVRFAEGF